MDQKKKMRLETGRLAYLDRGAGTPVVLLHGFCGSSLYWEKVIPLLEQHCRVIAPDLRGHGESYAPSGVYTMEAIAGDIAGLLDGLELGKAVVLGHSLGGYAALAFAEAYPDKLTAFGLIHSTALPDSDEAKENRVKGIKVIREKGIDAFVEGLVPKLFAPEHLVSMAEAVERAIVIGRATSPEGAVATQEGMLLRPDRNRVLEQSEVPVLLVAGSRDPIIPVEKTFSADKDTVTRVKLDQAGHMSMYEMPERLAEEILNFVRIL